MRDAQASVSGGRACGCLVTRLRYTHAVADNIDCEPNMRLHIADVHYIFAIASLLRSAPLDMTRESIHCRVHDRVGQLEQAQLSVFTHKRP